MGDRDRRLADHRSVRPDHQRVWSDLHKADVYVMTHVMELRRADGASFTPDEVEPLLAALHIGVSFALSQWAAPMLPVGEDADGRIVWEDWRPLHCDPAQVTSPDGGTKEITKPSATS